MTWPAHRDAIAQGRYLRVINYHNTPASSRLTLRRQLNSYREAFSPVGLTDLDNFYATGRWGTGRPGFLPVFYEGYRNSYDIAAAVCDELDITGWFAVCTGFVDCPVPEQEFFARSHWIDLVDEEKTGDRIAMSWPEIADLSARHVVYPHTASHDGIADVVSDEDLYREVVEPKTRMDAMTGQSAPAFAWLHGSPWGSSPRHDAAVAAAGYRYVFSNTMIHRIAK